MLLTEHAGKILLAEAGLAVPPALAIDAEPLADIAPPFPLPWFLKAQTVTGGRGRAGGVVRLEAPGDVATAAKRLFGMSFGGMPPPFLRLEPAVAHDRAIYVSLGVSRQRKALCLTLGRQGGGDVETLAGTPDMLVLEVPAPFALTPRLARRAFFHLEMPPDLFSPFQAMLSRLFAAVANFDLLLAEINPLAVTPEGQFVALDAKVVIDDNAVALRPELGRFGDERFLTSGERRARLHRLSFVSLPGRIGLVANGAGLAMATMDALDAAGLPAANFLDFGGTADVARLRAAFDMIFADPAVEACCVNMFGGILSCADVARALLAALGEVPASRPVVVRLSGNEADIGAELLRSQGLPSLHVAEDMDQIVALLSELSAAGPRRRFGLPRPGQCKEHLATGKAVPPVIRLPSLLDLDAGSGVLVQGITGRAGRRHARLMRRYGTNVVCGVTPFRGGEDLDGIPIHDTVAEAVARHDVALAVTFVPAGGAADAVQEAVEAGVPRIVCITDGIPQKDMLAVRAALSGRNTLLLGPNTPGVLVPGCMKAGIMPVVPFTPGPVAVFSRSGTLTYEVCSRLSVAGLGQAVAAGIGGDPFGGAGFVELCEMVRDDARVRAVMIIGEVGGTAEEELAKYVAATGYPKPMAAFVAGVTAPPGRTLGHAGAFLEHPGGVARKLDCLTRAGIVVCPELGDVAGAMATLLCGR